MTREELLLAVSEIHEEMSALHDAGLNLGQCIDTLGQLVNG